MNEEKGDSSGNGKVKRVTDAAEITNMAKAGARKGGNFFEQNKLESNMNSTFLAEEVGNEFCGREEK